MANIEIGMGKTASLGFALDDVSIVPSRRTRDIDDVDVSWSIDAFRFDTPVLAAPTDGICSPASIATISRLGGLGALHLEGAWTRNADPTDRLAELAMIIPDGRDQSRSAEEVLDHLRVIHAHPVDLDLISDRVRQMRESGSTAAYAMSPRRVV